MSSAQSPATPKHFVRSPLALAPRSPTAGSGAVRESSGRRVDVGTLADDLRCGCGRLLAKVVAGGLEIRCTRCKASHVLAWSEVDGAAELLGARAVEPTAPGTSGGAAGDP